MTFHSLTYIFIINYSTKTSCILTRFSVPGKTISVLKTHSSVFTNVNGQREGHAETREQGQYRHVVAAEC
jgi:hypothetical protein